MNKTLEKTIVGATAPTNKNVLWIDSNKNLIKYNNNNKWNVVSLNSPEDNEDSNLKETMHTVTYLDLLALIESNSLIPNHVYKLIDYSASVFLLNEGTDYYNKFVVNPLSLLYIIYLTASSTNTLFKEARMEFGAKIETFDKDMLCHYSPYISNTLPYNSLYDVNKTETINSKKDMLLYISPIDTYRYKNIDYTIVLLSGLRQASLSYKCIYIKGKYGNNRFQLLDAILEDPEFEIGYFKDNVSPSTSNWWKFMEKDNTGNIVFSKDSIFDILLKSYIYRGEITWMRDDLGNEAPYDFYSILHYYQERGAVISYRPTDTTIVRYMLLESAFGFINNLQPFSNRAYFRNNKATSLFTTIFSNIRNGITENNILDECILASNVLSCNNIVEKLSLPVIFSGSNNYIHEGSYIVADVINNCDIKFLCATLLPNMYECKLRGGAYQLMSRDSIVEYAEFNNPIYNYKDIYSTYSIYSRAIIDGYGDGRIGFAQVDRNKLGIFYVTNGDTTNIFTFKKGQTWLLWLYEVDYNMPALDRPYLKEVFDFDNEEVPTMIFKGNPLKRLDPVSPTVYPVPLYSNILEGYYIVPAE